MTVNNAVLIMAGFAVMAGLTAAHFTHQVDMTQLSWLWLVGFVGANLFQMGFTGFCPAKFMFRKLGLKDTENTSCCS